MNLQQSRPPLVTGLLLLFAALAVAASAYFGPAPAAAVHAAALVLAGSGFVALISSWHASLAFAAAEEESRRGESEEGLFTSAAGQHGKSLASFRKYILPALLILLAAAELAILKQFVLAPESFKADTASETSASAQLIRASLLGALLVASFMGGKVLAAQSHERRLPFLHPAASVLLWSSLAALVAALACLGVRWGLPHLSRAAALVLGGAVVLLALERPLLWLMDFYRPRRRGESEHPSYDSRLLGLFSHPRGVFGNLAELLEYQFGVKISDSSAAGFLRRVLLPLALIQGLSLLLLASIVHVPSEQRAMAVLPGGKRVELEEGLHLLPPWPLAQIRRETSRSIVISLDQGPDFADAEKKMLEDGESVPLRDWNHKALEKRAVLAGPGREGAVTLALVDASLECRVRPAAPDRPGGIAQWSASRDPRQELRQLLQSACTRLLVSRPARELAAAPPEELAAQLRAGIQSESERLGLGAEILAVRLLRLQPPQEAAEAWSYLLSERQEARRLAAEAGSYALVSDANAKVEAERLRLAGETEVKRRRLQLDSSRQILAAQYQAWSEVRPLYKTLVEMDAFEQSMQGLRKFVSTCPLPPRLELDLKKAQPDILSLEK
ncbi:MAG: hypothetical protein RL095_4113 [Verrucomicrobiota bacterium]|jgi:regulator of protease activity HflC (stomatin/prohibitin superfamily)